MPEILFLTAVYAIGASLTAYVIYDTADQARRRKNARLHAVAAISSLLWPLFGTLMIVTNLVGKHDTKAERDHDRNPLT